MIYIDRNEIIELALALKRELNDAITPVDVCKATDRFAKAIDPAGEVVSGKGGAIYLKTPEEQNQTWRRIGMPKSYGETVTPEDAFLREKLWKELNCKSYPTCPF